MNKPQACYYVCPVTDYFTGDFQLAADVDWRRYLSMSTPTLAVLPVTHFCYSSWWPSVSRCHRPNMNSLPPDVAIYQLPGATSGHCKL